MDKLELDSPFWEFSIFLYSVEAVRDECLRLQEKAGVDVNLLLFGAYLGLVEQRTVTPKIFSVLFAAIEGWHQGIVRNLRTARVNLEAFQSAKNVNKTVASELRLLVNRTELVAEKIEQAMIWNWLSKYRFELIEAKNASSETNLLCVLSKWGAKQEAGHFALIVDRAFTGAKQVL